MAARRPAHEQLNRYKATQKTPHTLTTSSGAPVGDKNAILTAGPRGPMLMQDVVLMDELSHWVRERIPERVVHSKGAGAHGVFEVTHDITRYCKASIFDHIGKKTPMFIRFSTVAGEKGSADTARDPRGFACKFYCENGNWDMVGNNVPIFFTRDALTFPSLVHVIKRNPVTNLMDNDMFWDFVTLRPECLHHAMFYFSDRGTPDGYRHMNGYGSHTYKMVNSKDEAVYIKFHFKTDQGIRNLMADEAAHLRGTQPDYATQDLWEAIDRGEYPSWSLNIQVMTFEQAENHPVNPFDMSKIWPHAQFPLIPVGRFTLNRNPSNYFAEVEQAAFDPAHLIPGIEPSPDKMLQGRLFAYNNTHFHRLGVNYLQIPINCPYRARVSTAQRDGPQTVNNNQGGAPNYHPNSFNGPVEDTSALEHKFKVHPDVARYADDDDHYTQPGNFWRKVLTEPERERLVENMAEHLSTTAGFIQERAVKVFTRMDTEFARRLQKGLDHHNKKAADHMRGARL